MGIEIKSKFDAEYRRVRLEWSKFETYELLKEFLKELHKLDNIDFVIQYIDEIESSLLPINNDDNYKRAIGLKLKPLRIILQKKGSSYGELHGYGQVSSGTRRVPVNKIINHVDNTMMVGNSSDFTSTGSSAATAGGKQMNISVMEDFRRVCSIIDVNLVPVCYRRVKLMRNSQKPLGFYIRDGMSMRATENGIDKVQGIFISRVMPNGLAESTGLLAVNDEIIEVNGIQVRGKTLDQVTDMMVANSSNLIITVKPANQNLCLSTKPTNQASRGNSAQSSSRRSGRSAASGNAAETASAGDQLLISKDSAVFDL